MVGRNGNEAPASHARGHDAATILAAGLLAPAGAGAATLFVRGSVGASGDCLSDAAACKTIADALTKERATPEVDVINVASGAYPEALTINQAQDSGLTIQGAGPGADPASATIVNPASGVAFTLGSPDSAFTLRRLRVVVPNGNTSGAISGSSTFVTLEEVAVDMQGAGNSSNAVSLFPSPVLDRLSVGGAWAGRGVSLGGSSTMRDSTIVAKGDYPVSVNAAMGDHSVTILRSRIQQLGALPALAASDVDILLDSSLVLGGGAGVSETNNTGAARTITMVSSTVDAGVLGARDGPGSYGVFASGSSAGSTTNAAVRGSIVLESQGASVGSGASSVTCRDSDLPDQTQAADATHGTIDCSHAAGNVTSAPTDLFAAPGTDYTLKPSSSAVDAVPEAGAAGAVSGTDFDGNPRVLDGNLDCRAVRDRGALELTGHANTPPVPAVSAPANAFIGARVPFTGSAGDEDPAGVLTFAWGFSDGATATGASASHAFAARGSRGATLTVTDSHGCTGTATGQVVVGGIGLSRATMLHRIFRVARARSSARRRRIPTGTAFRYTLTEASTMTITLQRKVGRRYRKAGTLTARGRAGRNSTRFSGRISTRVSGRIRRRALAPGRYRARLKARDRARNVSSTRTLTFTVVVR